MPASAPVSHIRTARPQQVIKQSSNYPKHILPAGRASHAIRQSLLEPSNETSHSSCTLSGFNLTRSSLEYYRINDHSCWSPQTIPASQCSNSHGKCVDVPNKLWIISPTRQEIRKWVTKFYAINIKRNILALVWGGV